MFCQSCGNPLVAITPTAPAGPPPGTPPPIVGPPPNIPPPSYQSPYYAPGSGAPQAPVHRAPWVLIVSAVVGLVVIMAGCGTALAVFNSRNANQSATGLGSTLETPSPAGSPSPVASASPTSTVPGQVSNPTLSVTVPSGWLLANKDNETITLIDPYGQSITIGSGPQNPPQTAQQNKSDLDTYFIGKYPDSKLCPNTKVTASSISGANGLSWQECFTLTSGSQSVQAAAPMFAGANSDGSVYYVVILLTPASNMATFIAQARPVIASIHWVLK
jgi:hypothetical protein